MYKAVTTGISNGTQLVDAIKAFLSDGGAGNLDATAAWTATAINLTGQTGWLLEYAAHASHNGNYNFPMKVVLAYESSNTYNYITLRSGQIVDKAGARNFVGNPSFEGGTTGWALDGTGQAGGATFALSAAAGAGYIQSDAAKVLFTGSAAGSTVLWRATDAALTAANYKFSAYVKMINRAGAPTSSQIKIYLQDANGAPAFDHTTAAFAPDAITAVEDGWYRIDKTFLATAQTWRVGVLLQSSASAMLVDGVMVQVGNTLNDFTLRSASNNTLGTILRGDSGESKVFFTGDMSAITANTVKLYIQGDKNSFGFVCGNTVDSIYNAGFYGRLITPTGNPIDAGNSTGVDVTAFAIATSSDAYRAGTYEGQIRLYRDAQGKFWQNYNVIDAKVGQPEYWSGRYGRYNKWGVQRKWLPFFRSLFMEDVYWRDRLNIIALFSPREGFRGIMPSMFTMEDVQTVAATTGKVYVNPRKAIFSGTCSAGASGTVLTDAGTTFTTLVRVGDVVRHIPSGKYVKVASVDSNTQITTTALGGATVWNANDYIIYRGIMFDIFKVGYKNGVKTNSINNGTQVDASFNNFTPFQNRRNVRARKQAIGLAE